MTQSKNEERTKHFSKETHRWLTNTWKDALHHTWSEKCKSKSQWDTISQRSESVQFSSVAQSCPTPWIAARQASLSITNSKSSLRLTSIEPVMPSSHLIFCRPLLLLPLIPPSISLLQWVNSSHEVAKVLEFSVLASFLPKKSQGWSPSEWTGWISPCSLRDSQESSPKPQFKSINSSVLSLLHSPTLTSIHDYWKNHSLD